MFSWQLVYPYLHICKYKPPHRASCTSEVKYLRQLMLKYYQPSVMKQGRDSTL